MTKGPAAVLLVAAFLAVGVACGPSDEEVQQLGGERNQQQPTQASSTPTVIELGDAEAVHASAEIYGHIPVRPASSQIESYRLYALDLINEDRAKHGVQPVRLGTNEASQVRAEDTIGRAFGNGNPLANPYFSEGLKPYMLYTLAGGTGRAHTAGSARGYPDRSSCTQPLVSCSPIGIDESIRVLQWRMVYSDAWADSQFVDSILRPDVDTVNIGLAWDDRRWVFVLSQEFEFVGLDYVTKPGFDGDALRLAGRPVNDLGIGAVFSIYFDPPPRPLTREERVHVRAHCLGGGVTDECDDVKPIIRVLRPPEPGFFYSDLKPNDVVADEWSERSDGTVVIRAVLGDRVADPGVYTVVIWSADLDIVLSEYSIFAY